MQLKLYFAILHRFWWLVLGLPLLVGGISLLAELRQPVRYAATARVMVSQEPFAQLPENAPPVAEGDLFTDFNLSHSWLSSEYILDDMPQVVSSRMFADDVQALLTEQGYSIDAAVIYGSLHASVLHRAVTISASAATPEQAEVIVRGAVDVLNTNGLKYWDRSLEGDSGLRVGIIDPVSGAAPIQNTRRMVLNVGLRTALALGAAVGLIFLLYYLDDTLRDRQQIEEWLGVQVLGVIPKE
ncbi:MAG: hypothetical protein HC876_19910 [Chloroflexaceae bacterium]|nr:hypothetical protein [Chloroflexaceae bacterium]